MADKDVTRTYRDAAQQFQPGTLIGNRYRIVRFLGAGGMGRVYLCHDEELHIDVALKLIRPELLADEKSVERFKNEVILARRVSHKNVARIHDLGEIDGLKFLTMSYIEGTSLREIINRTGPLALERTIRLAEQMGEGIAAAHEEGVIHRDLKPSNIMVDEQDRVFITDFGIARTEHAPDLTEPGVMIGTPAYLSPEQIWGEKADQQSDLYAFGLIFYEMLAGRLPFDSGTVQSFKSKDPADLDRTLQKSVPRHISGLIRKCLSPSRDARYESAIAVLRDFRTKQVMARVRLPVPFLAVLLILLTAMAAFVFRDFLFRNTPGPPPPTLVEQAEELRSVAVLPFVNTTEDENLDWMESGMADLLITDLSQWTGLRVISAERVYQTLEDLKISTASVSDADVVRLCEILNADYMVRGNLIRAGSVLRADAGLIRANRPQETRYFKATADRPEDVFRISHQLAAQIQGNLQSGSGHVAPSPETASIEAWKAFQQGSVQLRRGDFQKSTDSFQESIRYDPSFTRAYLKLAEALETKGDQVQAIEILQNALKRPGPNSKWLDLIRAREAMLQGDLEKAIDLYHNLAEKLPNDSEVLYSLAVAAEAAGDLRRAVATLEKLVKLDPNHPEAYFHLGKDVILMGDADKAISQYLLKALGISTKLNNRWSQADVLNAIGVAHERLGRYGDAVKYYNDSAAVKEEIGNKRGLAVSLSNIARIYLFQGQYAETEKILNRTLPVFRDLGDQKGIADVTNMYGAIREDQGLYEEALDYYKKALQIRKEMKNDQLTAQSYDNIGHIYFLQGKLDDAQVFWEQGLHLREAIGEESGVILSMQNIGFLQIAQGRLDKATKSFLDALQQSRAVEYENAIAVSLGNLGTIYFRQGRYQAALDSYAEAVQVLEKLKDQKGIAEYTKLAGTVYLEIFALPQAAEKLQAALQTAEEIGSTEMQVDTKIWLAQLYRYQGDLERSAKVLEEALQKANEGRYHKALLQGTIEKGFWLTATGRPNEAADLLEKTFSRTESGDIWVRLGNQYARAKLDLDRGRPSGTVEMCLRAIPPAEKAGANPYIYRFHSLAGQAYRALKSPESASEHFQKGKAVLEPIKDALPVNLAAGLMQMPDAKEIYEATR